MDSVQLFGSLKENFNIAEAIRIFNEKGVDACKQYHLCFFLPLLDGNVAMYSNQKNSSVPYMVLPRNVVHAQHLTINSEFLDESKNSKPKVVDEVQVKKKPGRPKKSVPTEVVVKAEVVNNKVKKFNSSNWFKTVSAAGQITDNCKPLLYKEGKDIWLNMVPQMPYINDERKFSDFDENACKAVQFILDHWKKAFCTDHQDQYEYLISWLANVCTGNRNKTIVWLRSTQGLGKSLMSTLLNRVLGINTVVEDSKTYSATGQFNQEVHGKLLYIFSDVTMNKNEFMSFYSSLKGLCDSETIMIREKYKNTQSVKNTASYMIFSNNNVLASEAEDRRMFIPDTSTEMSEKNDPSLTPHYNKLAAACTGEYISEDSESFTHPDIPAAFAAYMREWKQEHADFKEKKIPRSEARAAVVAGNLNKVQQFIKEYFVIYHPKQNNKAPLYSMKDGMPYQRFHELYVEWDGKPTRKRLSSEFGGLNLKTKQMIINKKNTKVFHYQHAELVAEFQRNGFLDEFDDYGQNDDPAMEEDVEDLVEALQL